MSKITQNDISPAEAIAKLEQENAKLREKIQWLQTHDPMTNTKTEPAILLDAARYLNRPLTVLMIKLADSYYTNRTYGTAYMKYAIIGMADVLKEAFGTECLYRYAVDAFTVFMVDVRMEQVEEMVYEASDRINEITIEGEPAGLRILSGYMTGSTDEPEELLKMVAAAEAVVEEVRHDSGTLAGEEYQGDDTRQDQPAFFRNYETDSLTGLLTPRSFRDACAGELEKEGLALLYLNLIDFQSYNEKFGYDKGDELLQNITAFLREWFPNRMMGLTGGNHFLVLANADEILDSIEALIRKLDTLTDHPFKAGVCRIPKGESSILHTIDRAKMAADSIRRDFSRIWRIYDDELMREYWMREYVTSHIDEAVDKHWIKVYYQPVIRSITGRLCGFEALARWEDPKYGLIYPGIFVDALEQKRLIHKLDICMIRTICKEFRDALTEGLPLVPVSFNLSYLDFELSDIYSVIVDALKQYKVPHHMINIEITESVLAKDPAYMRQMLQKFHEGGFQVWMDDFGSGYSTLNVLKEYAFDELKIDMEFLKRFGDRSAKIVTSVVDMSKRLGIQTLAEGVETPEHREFLRKIGCGRQQGYLYGKPTPWSPAYLRELHQKYGVERVFERRYYDGISAVNTLHMSENDFIQSYISGSYIVSLPVAIVEYEEDCFRILDANEAFQDSMTGIGIHSIQEVERLINDTTRMLARQSRRAINVIRNDGAAKLDLLIQGKHCTIRARYISEAAGKIALVVTTDTVISMDENRREERLEHILHMLAEIYEHIDVLHLDGGYTEQIFSNAGFTSYYDRPTLDEVNRAFVEQEVFFRDRERYTAFMDPNTMEERILAEGNSYLNDYFRCKEPKGGYSWRMFLLIAMPEMIGRQVLLCIRHISPKKEGFLQLIYDHYGEEKRAEYGEDPRYFSEEDERPEKREANMPHESDLTVTDGSLWRAIMNDDYVGYFWKDRERRFLGVNRKFMEYYNLDSVKRVLGKTDEDMGWHVDPEPFKSIEERVLCGEVIEDAPGTCIMGGRIRDIVATKKPIYRNGKIVGLVGYFRDVGIEEARNAKIKTMNYTDTLTGLYNERGIDAAILRFVEAYERQHQEFALVRVKLDDFERMNTLFGNTYTNHVLIAVADVLRSVAGLETVIARISGDNFFLLMQIQEIGEAEALAKKIEDGLLKIHEVDGQECTIYATTAIVLYTAAGGMKELQENAMRGTERIKEATTETRYRVEHQDKPTGQDG